MQNRRLIGSALAGCAMLIASFVSQGAAAQETKATVWPSPDWQTASPEDEGMDSNALAGLVAYGRTRSFDSLLITRHGRLVLDAYYAPYSANTPHAVNSTTKSIVATLIAMLHADDNKKAITVQHLLNMTSGLAWDEGLGTPRPLTELTRNRDWVRFILDRPMANQPGEMFYYNSGNSHLLSAWVTRLTGKPAEDFARDRLFGPLGITDYVWPRDPMGQSLGGWGLKLTPRDMAKFGYLYLRHG